MQAYSNPKRESDPHALPDVEYWEQANRGGFGGEGWYWWPCFPGCLPDGEPMGPFATEAECIADFTDEGEDE